MGLEAPSHWAILAVVVIVLFGYKKLPEMSRSVGRSLRIFKTEMKGMTDDDAARDSASAGGPSASVEGPAGPPAPAEPTAAGEPTAAPAAQAAPEHQPSTTT